MNAEKPKLEATAADAARTELDRRLQQAAQLSQQLGAADPALVLAGRGWHPGVIGIVAGRLAEKYHRPVLLVALDELGVKPGVGSARSVPGFDLRPLNRTHQSLPPSLAGHWK